MACSVLKLTLLPLIVLILFIPLSITFQMFSPLFCYPCLRERYPDIEGSDEYAE